MRPLAGRPGHYRIVAGERLAGRPSGGPRAGARARARDERCRSHGRRPHREPAARGPQPLEEARALQQLRETLKLTQEALAARLGKSRPAIANALRLLQLSPAAQDDLHHGRLSAGHARCLLAWATTTMPWPPPRCCAAISSASPLSVRQAEEAVALWREEQRLPWTAASGVAPQRPAPPHAQKAAPDRRPAKAPLRRPALQGPRQRRHESGRITLRYTSPQELEALLDRLHCRIPEDGPAGEAIAAPVDAKTPGSKPGGKKDNGEREGRFLKLPLPSRLSPSLKNFSSGLVGGSPPLSERQ